MADMEDSIAPTASGKINDDASQSKESHTDTGAENNDPAISETSEAGFASEIDALKQKLLELEARQAQGSPMAAAQAPIDPRIRAEREQYKRMEACLYKHRKEWEVGGGPGTWRLGYDFNISRGLWIGDTYWQTCDRQVHSSKKYQRPDPFDPTHKCDTRDIDDVNMSTMVRDEHDEIINWGNRRDRLRKTFEWELDRMFLNEELQLKRIEKQRADEDRQRRERRMAESDVPKGEAQNTEESQTTLFDIREPKLAWLAWYPFKLSSHVEGNPVNVIEILIGEPVTEDDVGTSESWFGASARRTKKVPEQPKIQTITAVSEPSRSPVPERIRIHSDPLLRIFAALLGNEARALLELKDMEAVFLRPYKALVYREKALRDWCKALEKKYKDLLKPNIPASGAAPGVVTVGDAEDTTEEPKSASKANTDTQKSEISAQSPETKNMIQGPPLAEHPSLDSFWESDVEGDEQEGDDGANDLTRSLNALSHLRCLLKFIDTNIVAKRNYLYSPECRKVYFSDLWHVFRPGVEVIGSDGKQAYKVISVSSARHRIATRWERWYDSSNDRRGATRMADLSLVCVYIDFDGVNIGPVRKKFKLYRFDGQRDITSLEVYPLRLHPIKRAEYTHAEWEDLQHVPALERYRQKLIHRGSRFLDVARGKHMYYAGATLETKDEVESPVVIDFETTFTMHDKSINAALPKENLPPPPPGQDPIETQHLTDQMNDIWQPRLNSLVGLNDSAPVMNDSPCNGECCRDEFVHDDQYVDAKLRNEYIESLLPKTSAIDKQPPITIMPRPMKEVKSELCSDEELVIMSYRVFGFVLRSRKFAKLDLTFLSDIHTSEHSSAPDVTPKRDGPNESKKKAERTLAFDRLVLEKGHHSMIVSLIAQHFRDKKSTTGQREEFDIVKGKGKGLIMLLHGAPGVGKTSTAEGVAELFKKPLFQITCGDLGTTATEVEAALEKNFSLANKWDCILLLDEADVFLAERTKEDFKRNGLVAVFLRLMEYYSGILFLTTNRVGDFDEAFTSRIHVSLYYPELNEDKTVRVFELNMDMIEDRFKTKGRVIKIDRMKIGGFAARYFAENPHARWNGRQIRNACQTALALAEFEAQDRSLKDTEDPDIVVNLRVEHFEVVRNAYLEFTKYINELHGTNAARRAKESRLRAIWIDEHDRVVKTQNMEGTALDKKQAFYLASQSQQSRPPTHSPQHSFNHHHPPPPAQRFHGFQQQAPYQQQHDRDPYQTAQQGFPTQHQQHPSVPQNWDPQERYARGYTPEPQPAPSSFQGSTPRGQQHGTPSPHQGQQQQQQQGRSDMPRFNEDIRNLYEASGSQGHEQGASGAGPGAGAPAPPRWERAEF